MKISTDKTDSMTFSKEPVGCKLMVDANAVQINRYEHVAANNVRNKVDKLARFPAALEELFGSIITYA